MNPEFINGVRIFRADKDEVRKWTGEYYFGYTSNPGGVNPVIWLRNDLPECVQTSVLAHEMYHAKDVKFSVSSVFNRETRANFAGLKAHPLGFLLGIWLSITDKDRLRLYLNRFTKNF